MRALRALALLSVAAALPLSAQSATLVPAVRVLTLAEALTLAEPASEALLLARAAELRADGQFDQARATVLPTVNGFSTYTRTLQTQFSRFAQPDTSSNGAGGLPFGQPNTWAFGLTASQTLFNLGAIQGLKSVRASRNRSRTDFSSQRAQVVLDVTRAYYDAVLADRLLEIADSTLVQAERTLANVTLAREVGTQPEFDRLRAEVARDNQKPVVLQRRTQRIAAFARLAQLLGYPAREPLQLTTPLGDQPGAPLPAFAQAVAERRDTTLEGRAPVRSAVFSLQAQQAALKATQQQWLPTLKLSSTYQQYAYPQRTFPGSGDFVDDWVVQARLDVPIFSGGAQRGAVRLAEATRNEAIARLRQARETAERERLEFDSQLEAAEASWAASRTSVEQARKAYAIAEVRFREGISTQTELADSRLQLQQSEANRAQAARDLQVARVRLLLLSELPFDQSASAVTSAQTTTQFGSQPASTLTTTTNGQP